MSSDGFEPDVRQVFDGKIWRALHRPTETVTQVTLPEGVIEAQAGR